MKSSHRILATALCLGLALAAQPMIASAQPQLTIQSERAAHPRLAAAINQLKEALKELEAAPDDFGGNKGAAINDTKKAIHSLKRALYYRLKMDDAAIDAAQ